MGILSVTLGLIEFGKYVYFFLNMMFLLIIYHTCQTFIRGQRDWEVDFMFSFFLNSFLDFNLLCFTSCVYLSHAKFGNIMVAPSLDNARPYGINYRLPLYLFHTLLYKKRELPWYLPPSPPLPSNNLRRPHVTGENIKSRPKTSKLTKIALSCPKIMKAA